MHAQLAPQPARTVALGPRQQRILAELDAGPHSLCAPQMKCGATGQSDRDLMLAALDRLEAHGLVEIRGRRGKNLTGVVVELAGEGTG